MKRYFDVPAGTLHFLLCGLSHIKSDILSEALLKDGIASKPLLYDVANDQYLGIPKKDVRAVKFLPVKPAGKVHGLWRPDGVPESVWEQAMKAMKFRVLRTPVLDALAFEICRHISDEDYLQLTADIDVAEYMYRLSKDQVAGMVVRRTKQKEYYFDKNLILCSRINAAYDGERTAGFPEMFNGSVWRAASVKWVDGMTFRECVDDYLATCTRSNEGGSRYSFVERLCPRIEQPIFERMVGNTNRKLFDRVRITVCLNSTMFPSSKELMNSLRENRTAVDALILEKIASSPQFQRYEVPVEDLYIAAGRRNSDNTMDCIIKRRSSQKTDDNT